MADDLTAIRDKARAHQHALDVAMRYWTVSLLAKRWDVSASTVRGIPRDELPYMEMGQGRHLKRRRYAPADVLAYETAKRSAA